MAPTPLPAVQDIDLLYADSDPAQRDRLAQSVASLGLSVHAISPSDLPDSLTNYRPHVLLVEAGASVPDVRCQRIVFCSPDQVSAGVREVKAGAQDLLLTPLDPESVVAAVRNIPTSPSGLTLHHSDDQVRTILEASPIPQLVSRVSDGTILYINDHLSALLGMTSRELLGQATPDFYHDPSDRERVLEAIRTDGHLFNHELRIKNKDGDTLWVLSSMVSTRLADEAVIIVGLYDITERKRIEGALRESEEVFRQLTDHIEDVFWMRDLKTGEVNYVSPAFHRAFGPTEDGDLMAHFMRCIHPEDIGSVAQWVEEMGDRSERRQLEYRMIRADGEVRWNRSRAFPIFDEAGEVHRICGLNLDFTDQREQEVALRASEKIFQQLTNAIDDVFWMYDLEAGEQVFVSESFIEHYGRKLDKDFTYLNIVHPEDRERMSEVMDRAWAGELVESEHQFRVVRQDGTIRWIRSRAFPVKNEAGEIYRFCGLDMDVTDRIESEEALRESQEIFTQLTDTIEDVFWMYDLKEDKRVFVSPGFASSMDVDWEEGSSYADVAHPDDRAQLKREMDETWGKPVKVDRQFRVVQRDGSIRWIRSRWFPILNAEGEVYRYCGLDIDMTERVEQEEALRESEEQFRQLTDNIDDVFWIFDVERDDVIFVSPIFEELYGGKLGKDLSYLDVVHSDDRERVEAIMNKGEYEPEQSEDIWRMIRKDGVVRWIRSRSFPIENAEGKVYRFCGLNVDITDRIEQEEALRTSEAEVRKALDNMEQANRDLRDAQTKLVQSEKMASLGNLVAGVAHEINTPIGAINSMHDTLMRGIEKLKDALEEALPDQIANNSSFSRPLKVIEEANRVIKTGTDRVTTIVRSLRSFARLDEAEKKEVPLSECLDDALTLVRHEVKGRVKIVKDYADLPPIVCYPSRLNQVFLNILVNAAQAIDGEGTIRIRTSAQEGDFVRIEIADDGKGIDAENLSRIFDPGFTTKGVGVGTGLGLSICYQIVQDHKGSIRAESEVGSGTTFLIDLPRAADEAS